MTNNTPDPRISRLPKWAQSYIRDLERKVTRLQDVVESREDLTTDSRAPGLHLREVSGPGGAHPLIPLEEANHAKWVHPSGEEIEIQVSPRGGFEFLHYSTKPPGSMAIFPASSNHFYLRAVEEKD